MLVHLGLCLQLLSNLLPPEVGADGGAAESPWQLQERKDIKLYLPRHALLAAHIVRLCV